MNEKEQIDITKSIPQQRINFTSSDIKMQQSDKENIQQGIDLKSNKSLNQFYKNLENLDEPIKEYWTLNFHVMKADAISLAIKFDLFEILNENNDFITVKDIINKLNWSLEGKKIIDWLDVLYIIGYLDRKEVGEEASYNITDYSKQYFLKNSPSSLYDCYNLTLKTFENFNNLVNEMPSGKFIMTYTDIYKHKDLMLPFKSYQKKFGLQDEYYKLLNNLNLDNNIKTIVDVSGREGFFGYMLAKSYPGKTIISLEKKEWAPLQKEYEKEINGFPNNLKLQEGDFLEKLPECDVVFVNLIVELLKEEDICKVMENAFNTLKSGGKLVIFTNLVNDDRENINIGMLRSYFILCLEIGGRSHSFKEIKDCLARIGFKNIDLLKKSDILDAVVAEK